MDEAKSTSWTNFIEDYCLPLQMNMFGQKHLIFMDGLKSAISSCLKNCQNLEWYLLCNSSSSIFMFYRSFIVTSSQKMFWFPNLELSSCVTLDLHVWWQHLVKCTPTMWQPGGTEHLNYLLGIHNMEGTV